MELKFSIIIPVYNRPQEVEELLHSISNQTFTNSFEVIIIEDGSVTTCETIVNGFKKTLNVHYFFKENSGAGASRNYGMNKATGNYFIILDSDVLLPPTYLEEVQSALLLYFTDAFGGADAAHHSFTNLQKAINYSMTSFFTTGGIRGSKKAVDKFQPRSFNLGLSKKAFEVTNGFSKLKIGEDIDLTFRLWENNFETQFIENAFVYHKRRSTIKQFFKQTFAFGNGRPFLNKRYPNTAKITYWFPSFFIVGLFASIFLAMVGITLFIGFYGIYFVTLIIDSYLKNKDFKVAFLSVISTLVQFTGYGLGFFKGIFDTRFNKKAD